MQRILLIILGASTAISGWLAFQYWGQLSDRESQVAALKVERDAARSAEQNAIGQTAPLKENVARLIAERDRLKAVANASDAPGTPPGPPAAQQPAPAAGSGDMLGGMVKMFKTEEGRKMMRAQTAMVVKMQYMDLAKRLKLSAQESDQLMGLLGDRQNALTEGAFGAFTDAAPDETQLKQLGEKAIASNHEFDSKIKTTLGEERFRQFQAYEQTIGERMMVTQFEPQLAAAGAPLEPAQKEQLIEIMSAERLKSPPGFDTLLPSSAASSQGNPAGSFSLSIGALKDDAAVERWMKQEQDLQRRVLQSATKILNPDQINALQQAYQQTAEMQKFGLKMGREMFKGTAKETPLPDPTVNK